MPRVIAALTLAAAIGASTAALAAGADTRVATVRLEQCSRADRSAVFYGRMSALPATERMWMRFTLQQRIAGGRFETVRAPGLRRWRKSRPGVRAFGYRQRVRNLAEGRAYRAVVHFRWLDGDGRAILRTRRRSRLCRQFQSLPNLRLAGLAHEGGAGLPPGVARYRVEVRNAGRAPAAQVPVRLWVDRALVDTLHLGRIGPRETQSVRFTGPACERPESPVRAVVDPDGKVAESAEGDNSRTALCSELG